MLSAELLKGFAYDGNGLHKCVLSNRQRWCEADDVVVRWLCQKSLLHHANADVPSRATVDGTGNDGIEQTASAHLFDEWRVYLLYLLAEDASHAFSILHQMFVLDHLQGLYCHTSGQGEASECGTVLARMDVQHDVVVGQASGNRQYATTQSLAQNDNVRTHAVVFGTKHATGSGYTRLHLIGYEQDIVLMTQVEALFQVSIIWNKDACLALNGFGNEGTNFLAILVRCSWL